MKISLIAALATNNVIGKENDLVWRLPDDFKRFKKITSDHFILMGRKTMESLGKPLPNRTHLVITRNKDYKVPEGHYVFDSVEEAFIFCQKRNVTQLYVIGGGEIYKQTLPIADELVLTEVEATPEGDTYFPEFDKDNWKISYSEYHPADERHQYAFTYVNYERIHQ
jgi:dihydrofolate reductase